MTSDELLSYLRDAAQGASNSAASNVSGPVDLLAWLLRKGGVPVPQNALGGSQWMAEKGLTAQPKNALAGMAGETLGMVGPIVAAAKAPQIANALLKVGENASARPMLNPQTGAIVWHGSPHKFDKFDASKIGTGEGAQAYGHGLYLAESPVVAKTYTTAGTNAATKQSHQYTSPLERAAATVEKAGGDVNFAIKRLSIDAERGDSIAAQAVKALQSGAQLPQLGLSNLYKVDLPDEHIAKMLDWDKPLSQQAPVVRKLFEPQVAPIRAEMAKPADPGWGDLAAPSNYDPTGQELLGLLRNRDAQMTAQQFLSNGLGSDISAMLRKQGIPGIRYLDGGSRGAGAGTSNYVIFPQNENLLRILERNGKPIK